MFLALSALLDFTLLSVFMLSSAGAIDFIVKWLKCVYEIVRINQKYTRLPAAIVLIQSILSYYIDSYFLYQNHGINELESALIAHSLHIFLFCVATFIIVKYVVHKYKDSILIVYIFAAVYNVSTILEAALEKELDISQHGTLVHSFVFTLLIMYIFWGNPLDCIRKHLDFSGTSGGSRNNFHY